uniref:Uncharacterized protein n=2 Tax=Vibrio TaxID=662 RepID=A0A0H3ZSF5_9VIBR|nr:hypothetical protein [Vibrio tasmaniensis]AKN38360.1 hypothetical protein [Vibrio sp. FF_371]
MRGIDGSTIWPPHTIITRSYSPETKSVFSSQAKRRFDSRRPNPKVI